MRGLYQTPFQLEAESLKSWLEVAGASAVQVERTGSRTRASIWNCTWDQTPTAQRTYEAWQSEWRKRS